MTPVEELQKALADEIRTDEELRKLIVQKKRIVEVLRQELDKQHDADEELDNVLEREQITNGQLLTDARLLSEGNASPEDIVKIRADLSEAATAKQSLTARLELELKKLQDMQSRLDPASDLLRELSTQTKQKIQAHITEEEEVHKVGLATLSSAMLGILVVIAGYKLWETNLTLEWHMRA
ncbi:MAG: hypothetical protein ABIA93_02910 [Candidatus Woesearchaeota archaeon]